LPDNKRALAVGIFGKDFKVYRQIEGKVYGQSAKTEEIFGKINLNPLKSNKK
jgi:hypothetical protein